MIKQFETALFFAATVSALALAAVVGMQEFSAGPAVQQRSPCRRFRWKKSRSSASVRPPSRLRWFAKPVLLAAAGDRVPNPTAGRFYFRRATSCACRRRTPGTKTRIVKSVAPPVVHWRDPPEGNQATQKNRPLRSSAETCHRCRVEPQGVRPPPPTRHHDPVDATMASLPASAANRRHWRFAGQLRRLLAPLPASRGNRPPPGRSGGLLHQPLVATTRSRAPDHARAAALLRMARPACPRLWQLETPAHCLNNNCVPISIARFGGIWKKSDAGWALRSIQPNRRRRQAAIVLLPPITTACRDRKNEVSAGINSKAWYRASTPRKNVTSNGS